MALNLVDKAFLQGIMSYKAMPAAEALKYYNSCETKIATHENRVTKKLRDQHALSQKIDNITRIITPHGYSLRGVYSPWERRNYFVMINTVDDDSGEAANMLTKAETGMFFDLVEALLDNEGQILKNDALDCGRDHRMTPTDAELALSRMERMKWFKTVKTGPEEEATLVFGPRAIGELPHVRNFTRNLAINRPNNVANGGGNHHNRGGGNVNVVIDDDDDEAEEDASYPVGNTKGDDNDDDEEEEEVVVARSARRSMLPRMSQDRELREVDNDEDEEVEDADEDEDVVQEVQQARHSRGSRSSSYRSGSQQSQRMTRSRSSRSRSSQYD